MNKLEKKELKTLQHTCALYDSIIYVTGRLSTFYNTRQTLPDIYLPWSIERGGDNVIVKQTSSTLQYTIDDNEI